MSRYYKIVLPDAKYNRIYSAYKVEKNLKELIEGNGFYAIFVRAENLEYADLYQDYWDFTIMGGEILVPFNNFTLGLIIHGAGLMKYCIYPALSELDIVSLDIDELENTIHDNNVFYDAGDTYHMNLGLIVEKCAFETTERYPFSSGWDKEMLDNSNSLPKKLKLETEFLDVLFCGSEIEYFYIDFKSKD